jgi:hypothetical protein
MAVGNYIRVNMDGEDIIKSCSEIRCAVYFYAQMAVRTSEN